MLKECCQKEENLKVTLQEGDKTIRTCQVCGCNHYELSVDPGVVGIEITSLAG